MYLNSHIPEHAKILRKLPFHVRDLDTGKDIPDVIWANDKIGIYCVYVRDEKGQFLLSEIPGQVLMEERSGNIVIYFSEPL